MQKNLFFCRACGRIRAVSGGLRGGMQEHGFSRGGRAAGERMING